MFDTALNGEVMLTELIRDTCRPKLALEQLEDRRLLTQTPELISDLRFDLTFSEGEEAVSPFFEVDNALVSRTNTSSSDLGGRLEVFRPSDSQRLTLDIPSQQPESMLEFNGSLYLWFDRHRVGPSGMEPGVGQQLWKVDGTSAVLVAAISELGTSSLESVFTNDTVGFEFRDYLYFPADAGVREDLPWEIVPGDFGLWRTDGTAVGTVPVTNLIPDLVDIHWAKEVNNRILLSVDRTGGSELWSFDGTENGTFSILDSVATEPVVLNDRLYFVAESGLGTELHISDGTRPGTHTFADLMPGSVGSDPRALLLFGNELWFIAQTENQGFQRWATGGVLPPTVRNSNPIDIPTGLSNAPSEVLLATETWILYSQISSDRVTLEGFGAPDGGAWGSRIVLDLWISNGPETAPELLARINDVVEFAEPDSDIPPWVSAQLLGDKLTVRLLTSREQGEQMHYTSHAVDLPDPYVHTSSEVVSDGSSFARFNSLAQALVSRPLKPGDITLDGKIRFDDFLLFASNYGNRDAVWQDGDFDDDGVVDFADFLLLSANFGN